MNFNYKLKPLPFKPGETYIVVFTRGRIDKQKTLQHFSQLMLSRTIVVTCQSEAVELRETLTRLGIAPLAYRAFPDEYKLITKRYLIAKWLHENGCTQFMMADDDILLKALVGDNYRTTKKEEGQKALDQKWRGVNALFKDYQGIGFSFNSRNNRNFFTEERRVRGFYVQENTKNTCFFGYRTKSYVEWFEFGQKHELLQEIAYIDLLANVAAINHDGGSRIARVYDLTFDTGYSYAKEDGGLNLYRTKATNLLAMMLIMLLQPGRYIRRPETHAFGIFKLTRQAYKPVTAWRNDQFHWAEWYAQVDAEVKRLEKIKPFRHFFSTDKGFTFVNRLISKLRFMASENPSPQNILYLSEKDGPRFRAEHGKAALKKVASGVQAGYPIHVRIEGKSTQRLKDIEKTVYSTMLRQWLL